MGPLSTGRRKLCRGIAAAAIGLALSPGLTHAGEQVVGAAGRPSVLSGGVGEGARKQLAEQARDYGLKLVFTLSSGNFISDVAFEVASGGKVMVKDVARGPWAFVNVPPGSYTVTASYEGHAQTRKVTVPKKGQRSLPFSWPAPARVQQQPK